MTLVINNPPNGKGRLLDGRERLLEIKERLFALDDLVKTARAHLETRYLTPQAAGEAASAAPATGAAPAGGKPPTTTDLLLQFIRTQGIGAPILKLTTTLNKTALDDTQRLLLSTPGVYESILLRLLIDQKASAADTEGLRHAVLVEVDGEYREFFLEKLLQEFIEVNRLKIDQNSDTYARLRDAVFDATVPLAAGRTNDALTKLFKEEGKEGELRHFVDLFAGRGEIDSKRFTSAVKTAMVDYLETLGLVGITHPKFNAGRYDEYFVQAYHHALFGPGRAKPALQLVTIDPSDADFTMDTFELAEEQGVVRDHILAASALYMLYILGDRLGVFELPKALILRRARGRLDLSRGSASFKLQEYKRYLRTSPLEVMDRQLLYRRVFNEGDGEVLPDTVVNEEFPILWHALMQEVADYIRKTEDNSSDLDDKISRDPIYEAMRNLQYNLSFYAADIGDDVRDMIEQFEMAKTILSDPEIIAAVGIGRRQNMWAFIERLLAEDIKRTPYVPATRTLGVEGYKLLQSIANFDIATPDDEFKAFVKSAKRWILAQASIGEEEPADEDDEAFDEDPEEIDNEDEDWES